MQVTPRIPSSLLFASVQEAVSAIRDVRENRILTRGPNPVTNWTQCNQRDSTEILAVESPNDFLTWREPVEAEPDRQANEDHVYKKTLDKAAKLVRANCVQSTEWQHNQIHYQKKSDPIKHSANNEVGFQEVELTACCAINRGGRISDEIVQNHAENPRAGPPVKRPSP